MRKEAPNNPMDKKLAAIIVIGTYLVYYLLGYMLKTDILNAITFHRHGMSISFIGIFLLLITSIFVSGIIEVIRRRRANKKNQ